MILLKVHLDDSLPFLRDELASKANTMVPWFVSEDFPLNVEAQLENLARSIGVPLATLSALENTSTLMFRSHGEVVDTSKTAAQAKLVSGAALFLGYRRVLTPRAGTGRLTPSKSSGSFGAASMNASASASVNRRAIANTSGSMEASGAAEALSAAEQDAEELYESATTGWFPFLVRPSYGGRSTVRIMGAAPPLSLKEDQSTPQTQSLCDNCSQLVAGTPATTVSVDRHYRPLSSNSADFCLGWLEKLTVNPIQRWQKRYVMASERNFNWFLDEPQPGVKAKIKGTRAVIHDGNVNVQEVIDQPDPAVYPKCKNTNYYHFGIVFREPSTTEFFRTDVEHERTKFVNFVKGAVIRGTSKSALRDPVFWKQWSDAYLSALADLREIASQQDSEIEQLTERLRSSQSARTTLVNERPMLEGLISQRRSTVQALRTDLDRLTISQRTEEAALVQEERAVETESEDASERDYNTGAQLRQTALVKTHALGERDDCEARVKQLEEDLVELRARREIVFNRWRRHEEQGGSGGNPVNPLNPVANNARGDRLTFSIDGTPLPSNVRALPPELSEFLTPERLLPVKREISPTQQDIYSSYPQTTTPERQIGIKQKVSGFSSPPSGVTLQIRPKGNLRKASVSQLGSTSLESPSVEHRVSPAAGTPASPAAAPESAESRATTEKSSTSNENSTKSLPSSSPSTDNAADSPPPAQEEGDKKEGSSSEQ